MTKIAPRQLSFDVDQVGELEGVEMGVFSDGTAFLTGRGLSRMAGVAARVVNSWALEFDPDSGRRRDEAIARLLLAQGFEGPLYVEATHGGRRVHAFPEKVCMAVLEYYAFEAAEGDRRPEALNNYRVLARAGLRAFVHTALGYVPTEARSKFDSFNTRLLMNQAAPGYFAVITESAHLVLHAIRHGLVVDQATIPDISVGMVWAKHWADARLEAKFGERKSYEHRYPSDYPQSASERAAWMYPLDALVEFRKWLDDEYLPKKYPTYLKGKVKQGALPASTAELLLAAFVPEPDES